VTYAAEPIASNARKCNQDRFDAPTKFQISVSDNASAGSGFTAIATSLDFHGNKSP
jgi:hypothetical protein